MGIGNFMLDFFFGPCLDANDAVDERQYEPRPQHKKQPEQGERRRRRSHDKHQQPEHSRAPPREHRNQRPSSSRGVVYPPSIPENQEQVRFDGNGGGDQHGWGDPLRGSHTNGGNQHARGSPLRGSYTNGGDNHGRGDPSRSSGTSGHRPSHKTYSRHRRPETSKDRTEISSLSDDFHSKRRTRRDDAASISASLYESYTGLLAEDGDDYLDQQSAIRHSLKDAHKARKKRNKDGKGSLEGHVIQVSKGPSSGASHATGRSELETWIEKGNGSIRPSSDSIDYENVTTISKASKNPYGVLGIAQGASPRDIYGVYKRKMKETERRGGSNAAFEDIGNAYRRIRADIKRREAREERRRSGQRKQGGQRGRTESRRKLKKKKGGNRPDSDSSSDSDSDANLRRETIDARLKDHRELVEGLFKRDNSKSKRNRSDDGSVTSKGKVTTLQDAAQSQGQSLSEMNLVPVEAGATNVNEQNKKIQNSCFYLSLAASYLSGAGAFDSDPTESYYRNALKAGSGTSVATLEMEIATLGRPEKQLTMDLALQLKRAIEAAVLLVHPDWAKSGMVGEEVQAFSDFLVYALDSDSVLGHWAIAVFDEASGFVDVYRGRHYGKVYPPKKVRSRSRGREKGKREGDSPGYVLKYRDCDEHARRACTLTLRYVPGHYQPLLPELTKLRSEGGRSGGGRHPRASSAPMGCERPTLEEILTTLDRWKVLHVVTDGRA